MAELFMPKLSDTMEEGTILQWMKGEGDDVQKGEPLLEVETDKANMVVEAPESGALHIVAAEGETLPVGAPIAAIGEGAAPAPRAPDIRPEIEGQGLQEAVDHDKADGEEEATNIPLADDGTGAVIGMAIGVGEGYPDADDPPAAEAEPRPAPAAPPDPAPAGNGGAEAERVKASPLARNLARELGVDLALVRGTGPGGRIVRADVEAASQAGPAPAAAPEAPRPPAPERTPPPAPAVPTAEGRRTPLTRLQRTIAARMSASWSGAPHFFLQRDLDATDLLTLRRELVEAAAEGEGPSVNDLIVRAVALAAAEHPEWLRQYDGDALVQPGRVDVGIAVAADRGLLVPAVRDAASKSVGRIARETQDLVARTRDGSITPAELEGSTISISNLGMFGIDRFTAVLNPPEPAILAVGRARPAPVARDGEVVIRDVMTLTLSVDHRALQGADGARLLARIAELLERPHALVL